MSIRFSWNTNCAQTPETPQKIAAVMARINPGFMFDADFIAISQMGRSTGLHMPNRFDLDETTMIIRLNGNAGALGEIGTQDR